MVALPDIAHDGHPAPHGDLQCGVLITSPGGPSSLRAPASEPLCAKPPRRPHFLSEPIRRFFPSTTLLQDR